MVFSLAKSLDILAHTPDVLQTMLQNTSADWTSNNEGGETWSVYDTIGHLIHGEKTDWITRAAIILSKNEDKTFEAFNRFAQFEDSDNKSLTDLLYEFKILRKKKY